MLKKTLLAAALSAVALNAYAAKSDSAREKNITLHPLGSYASGVFAESAAEIVAYDADTMRLFVINADANTVDVLSLADPANPGLLFAIDAGPYGGGVNSVAVHGGLVALAVQAEVKTDPGKAVFFDTDGNYLNQVDAGALPDAITFTHNGNYALVANEGEPNGSYTIDPEGSITVIDLRGGVMAPVVATAGFAAFNAAPPAGVRLPRPFGATVAQDLEPEFIATSHDSKTAWVTLQENNALAIVDIPTATVTDIVGLGNKDHALPGNGLDASDRDDAINIANWPVLGTYMPDGIAAFRAHGRSYVVTANEGDAREYFFDVESEEACEAAGGLDYDEDDGCLSYVDEARVKDVDLDPAVFTDPDLQDNEQIGRLKMLLTEGDTDGDGEYEEIHSYGARSISIRDAAGDLVYDSGDIMEYATSLALPDDFNSTNDENDSFDDRSDDKGPEPEGVVVGSVQGRQYAFVGLERVGGIMIFDVTRPEAARYVGYVNNRDFSVTDPETPAAGDLGPEGLLFIKAEDSPNGAPLLVVGNEVSGTTTVYEITAD
jgi:DNA-binding beta-propeller fold protein YncE